MLNLANFLSTTNEKQLKVIRVNISSSRSKFCGTEKGCDSRGICHLTLPMEVGSVDVGGCGSLFAKTWQARQTRFITFACFSSKHFPMEKPRSDTFSVRRGKFMKQAKVSNLFRCFDDDDSKPEQNKCITLIKAR